MAGARSWPLVYRTSAFTPFMRSPVLSHARLRSNTLQPDNVSSTGVPPAYLGRAFLQRFSVLLVHRLNNLHACNTTLRFDPHRPYQLPVPGRVADSRRFEAKPLASAVFPDSAKPAFCRLHGSCSGHTFSATDESAKMLLTSAEHFLHSGNAMTNLGRMTMCITCCQNCCVHVSSAPGAS